MLHQTLLARSGQRWRMMWAMPAGEGLGLALVFLVIRNESRYMGQPGLAMSLVALGLTIAMSTMVWAALTIRCPRCATRLLWKAVTERGPTESLSWVLRLETCPVCGSDGTPQR